jgi:hypothetical protein
MMHIGQQLSEEFSSRELIHLCWTLGQELVYSGQWYVQYSFIDSKFILQQDGKVYTKL